MTREEQKAERERKAQEKLEFNTLVQSLQHIVQPYKDMGVGYSEGWTDRALVALHLIAEALPKDTPVDKCRKVMLALYPWGERENWPYKAWLNSVKRALMDRYPEKKREILLMKETKKLESKGLDASHLPELFAKMIPDRKKA